MNDMVRKRIDDDVSFCRKVDQLKYITLALFLEKPLPEIVISANHDTQWRGFHTAQSLSPESVPCEYVVVETAKPWGQC